MDNKTTKRYFVTGGGTGGHIYPALAVINELRANGIEDIFYVGNPKNQECELAKENNIKFLPVNVNGMPRKMSLKSLFWAIKLVFAILKCLIYVRKYKPDVVFATGGYVSAPLLFAAKFKNIPYFLHDADAQIGVVTRCFSSGAIVLSTPFESVKKSLQNVNVQVTGNPIRNEFSTLSKEQARLNLGIEDNLTILVMGGSQGARSINNAIVPIAKKLIEEFNVCIIHQSGKKRYDEVLALLNEHFPAYKENKNYRLLPYIDDMPSILKSSDIAIARSGSLSLSEIQASKVASILIPYPYSAGGHQQKNAQELVEQGSAEMIIDFELTPELLYKKLSELLNNKDKLIQMQNKAIEYSKPNAVKQITKNILDFLNE
ncbi:undecaprenyldiphospho-muramoylpentapeptide beta-N-acetylglucosaminyltransferase [bacterium]|nr:undecaprenyldiphospho-muramoylpentapeptide beta-N-acetylglucosaminyltransferase [bacterium]